MRFTSVKPSYDIYLNIFKRLSNILFHLVMRKLCYKNPDKSKCKGNICTQILAYLVNL